MDNLNEFSPQDLELIEKNYGILLEASRKRCASEEEVDTVRKAFEFANTVHKDVRRTSGDPYIIHPLEVARLVVNDIGLGCKSICAALLHDVIEDSDYTVEDIRILFGDKIAALVDGLNKIKSVLSSENSQIVMSEGVQAENFKRILLTMNDDVRVVIIKLADRLDNCRNLKYLPENKRERILNETMLIFIPLAHRLGLYGIKSEMEDIWLQYKEPQAYAEISGKLSASTADREKDIVDFIAPISAALDKAGFKYEVKKRIKAPYSIWKKIMEKGVTFDQIYDLYAVRIIFDTDDVDAERRECFHIFSLISGIYGYKPDRLRNWIDHPKSNGYEALHCTFMSNAGIWIEVQIRSRRMDEIAEKGIAAHWLYKKRGATGPGDIDLDQWISKVKDILSDPDVNALQLLDIIHNDLYSSDIYIFDTNGEQMTVRKGSTALDFAYLCGRHIGDRAIAAKVNKKLVPLTQVLRSGDQVEIITAEEAALRNQDNAKTVCLELGGKDRIGIINDITKYISLVMGINIKKINIASQDSAFSGELELCVQDEEGLEKLMKRLSKIEGMDYVKELK